MLLFRGFNTSARYATIIEKKKKKKRLIFTIPSFVFTASGTKCDY